VTDNYASASKEQNKAVIAAYLVSLIILSNSLLVGRHSITLVNSSITFFQILKVPNTPYTAKSLLIIMYMESKLQILMFFKTNINRS